MGRPGILTITTDFGAGGPYVAAMKGVVLGLAPGVSMVDVTHAVTPQNVLEGAFILADLVETFPTGTVHLAVIDPGVGTDRRLIAASVLGQWFVLPDNGLISGVTRHRQVDGVWEITNPALRRSTVSATFHGRDILAPAAAHLVNGGDPSALGAKTETFHTLRNFRPLQDDLGVILGEVIFRDTFGNLITNVGPDQLDTTPPEQWAVEIGERRIEGLTKTYADRPEGSLLALVGSGGWVEIAVVNGDAASWLAAGQGTTVRLRRLT